MTINMGYTDAQEGIEAFLQKENLIGIISAY